MTTIIMILAGQLRTYRVRTNKEVDSLKPNSILNSTERFPMSVVVTALVEIVMSFRQEKDPKHLKATSSLVQNSLHLT